MRIDHEELILRNPALGACAFWHLSRKFAEDRKGAVPTVPYFFIAGGMLFHSSTVDKIHRMQFDSGILKAVSESPELIAGLQGRIEHHHRATLLALQVGTATGVLNRENGDRFAGFRAAGNLLPKAVREGEYAVADIFSAARRLGAWFALDDLAIITRQLSIEF